ncbi:MAG: phospholipase A2 [Solirubrobacterales bacterium]
MGLVALVALAGAVAAAVGEVPTAGLPRALAAAILPAGPGASEPAPRAAPASERKLVERLMAGELGAFLRYRGSAERDERLDYSTDECSAPVVGSSGQSFDFTEACLRHDFGYRNYGRLGLLDGLRRSIDERFLTDMQAHCATRAHDQVIRCLAWARDFYRGVRAFGWIPASRYE